MRIKTLVVTIFQWLIASLTPPLLFFSAPSASAAFCGKNKRTFHRSKASDWLAHNHRQNGTHPQNQYPSHHNHCVSILSCCCDIMRCCLAVAVWWIFTWSRHGGVSSCSQSGGQRAKRRDNKPETTHTHMHRWKSTCTHYLVQFIYSSTTFLKEKSSCLVAVTHKVQLFPVTFSTSPTLLTKLRIRSFKHSSGDMKHLHSPNVLT